MNDKNKIGIIGLGLVGAAISYRLIDSGFDVVGYDINNKSRIN